MPTWATNNVGTASDNVQERIEALDVFAGLKGAANGLAELDASVTLPVVQLPADVTNDTATGLNATLTAPGNNVLIRLTDGSLASVDMIPAPAFAQRIILINATGGQITINDLTGGTPADQIITGTGANLDLDDDAAVIMTYDTTETKWRVVGGSGGGVTFPLLAPDGSAGAPSYSFTNDSDTGLYLNGTVLTFAQGGSARWQINATTFGPTTSESVDIGTAALAVGKTHTRNIGIIQGTTEIASFFRGNNNNSVLSNLWQGLTLPLTMLTSGDATADANPTDSIYIETGNKTAGTGDSGAVVIQTGTSAGGTRGDIELDTPTVDAANAEIQAREATIGTSTGSLFSNIWGTEIPGLIVDGQSTDFGTSGFGGMAFTGNSSDGEFGIITADGSGTNGSSRINIYTGFSVGTSGASGTIDMFTGDNTATSGNTGSIFLTSGESTNSNSGNLRLLSGNAASGTSGVVELRTGTGSTRGGILLVDGSEGSVGHVWTSQDAGGTGGWAALPSGGNKSVASYSTATTVSVSDEVVLLSGASFNLQLFTAVANTGHVIEIVHQGTSLTQVYSLTTTGGQTVGGEASGNYTLVTNGERVRLVSDGTNWVVLDHHFEVDWTDSGVIALTGVTSDPTKGTTSTDTFLYYRDQKFLHFKLSYTQTAAGAAGSGAYEITLPSSLAADTTNYGTSTNGTAGLVGWSMMDDSGGAAQQQGAIYLRSSTTLGIRVTDVNNADWGSGFMSLANTTVTVHGEGRIPISGWV